MTIYYFGGLDTSSDRGVWEIAIIANNFDEAKAICKSMLKDKNREDLIDILDSQENRNYRIFSPPMIVYNTVERREENDG